MGFDMQSLGSLLVTIFFIRSMVNEFVPQRLLNSIKRLLQDRLLPSRESSMVIEEFDLQGYSETFELALKYLSFRFSDSAAVVRVADDGVSSRGYSFAIDLNQALHDDLDGVPVLWSFRVKDSLLLGRSGTNRVRYLELSFAKSHTSFVRHHYFPAILRVARQQEAAGRVRKLYTNSSTGDRGSLWSSVVFDHPSTFDTLAVDPELKAGLMNDLRQFTAKGEYYKRVGRTWKRGYLIYGPPGTGKTSLIAAMANYLEFDVYDLELSAVTCNSQLRRLLVETRRRSLIVIEDIDRSISAITGHSNCNGNCRPRGGRMMNEDGWCGGSGGGDGNCSHWFGDATVEGGADHGDAWSGTGELLSLSGILNFMDGLWSSCGQERLMVVTTNHKERLDPALLRPGRLDVHIHLSYCGVPALRALAANYLYPNPAADAVLEEEGKGRSPASSGGIATNAPCPVNSTQKRHEVAGSQPMPRVRPTEEEGKGRSPTSSGGGGGGGGGDGDGDGDGDGEGEGSHYGGEAWEELEGLVRQVEVTPATVAETFLGSATPTAGRSQLAELLRQEAAGNGKKNQEEER